MIDVIKQTPIEYSKESRDYQIISRLYTALFNVSKMYIDNMEVWNSDIDDKLATLRAKTVNFQIRHTWDLKDLEAITACFKYLMMYKGTVAAIKIILSIIMKIEKIDNKINSSSVVLNGYKLTIKIEKDLASLGIIDDLLRYVLPAGLTYRILRYISYDDNSSKVTDMYFVSNNLIDDEYSSEGNSYSNSELSADLKAKKYPYSKKMFIGNNESKIRKYTETFIYGDDHNKKGNEWQPDALDEDKENKD